jgi:hypothetical protein
MSEETSCVTGAWTPILASLPEDVATLFRKSLESSKSGYQSRSAVALWRANLEKSVLEQPNMV